MNFVFAEIRIHPIAIRILIVLMMIGLGVTMPALAYAETTGSITGFFSSTDAYMGFGMGASSGFAFSEYINARAWKARDLELTRLKEIEKAFNLLRTEALMEKLNNAST